MNDHNNPWYRILANYNALQFRLNWVSEAGHIWDHKDPVAVPEDLGRQMGGGTTLPVLPVAKCDECGAEKTPFVEMRVLKMGVDAGRWYRFCSPGCQANWCIKNGAWEG